MKIVSVNIGVPMTLNWKGSDIVSGIYKFPVERPLFLGQEGVNDDHVIDTRYHGGKDKACYLYSSDHYEYWKGLYPDAEWKWGMFGENLTVEDLDESRLLIGDTFRVGKALIQITQPRQPCFKLGIRFGNQDMVKEFSLSGFPGAYVRILEEGEVNVGNVLELVESYPGSPCLTTVFNMLYFKTFDVEEVITVTENKFLAASCRKDLIKKWNLFN